YKTRKPTQQPTTILNGTSSHKAPPVPPSLLRWLMRWEMRSEGVEQRLNRLTQTTHGTHSLIMLPSLEIPQLLKRLPSVLLKVLKRLRSLRPKSLKRTPMLTKRGEEGVIIGIKGIKVVV
ncbi:hypothetical protein KSS87_005805, partial [Heliosperma pusillum]